MLNTNDSAFNAYTQARQAHWDAVAQKRDSWRGWGGAYHRRIRDVYRHLVAPGQRVLEVCCGTGDLLAALEPKRGVGVDFSAEMIRRGRERHPEIEFVQADAHDLSALEGLV
jgi:ubiquinone/menaquinone biosynthesis C-methylase UbiE